MKRRTTCLAPVAGLVLALAGCASPNQPALSRSNPADPHAAEALSAAAPVLMTGTNYAMAPQPEQPQPPNREHGPATKQSPSQDDAHHEHQHESPKQ
jgi:hypothetical protein